MTVATAVGRAALITASLLVTTSAFALDAASPPPAPQSADMPAQNTVFAEGLGAGVLYSINYERRVIDELGVRAGFGYWGASAEAGGASSKASYLTIPITASYLGLHSRKATFEVGGGMTFSYASGSASTLGSSASGSGVTPYGVGFVGYRLHPVGAGFNFRIGAMLLAGKGLSLSGDAKDADKIGFLPWGYMSLGASF